jgi:hypothetical protein
LSRGAAALRPLSPAARVVLAAYPVRQARNRTLRPAALADARGADGRHPRGARRGRLGACGSTRGDSAQSALRKEARAPGARAPAPSTFAGVSPAPWPAKPISRGRRASGAAQEFCGGSVDARHDAWQAKIRPRPCRWKAWLID